jgi:glutamate-1-semialdehyde aminotransferase
MQYAILCYHDEKVTCAWSKEHDDAVMAKLGVHGAAYGLSSGFHLAFDPQIVPGQPDTALALPPDTLKKQRGLPMFGPLTVAMLMRGVHVFAMGGFVSVAHGAEDIARTAEAFEGALRQIEEMLPQ